MTVTKTEIITLIGVIADLRVVESRMSIHPAARDVIQRNTDTLERLLKAAERA